MKIDIWYGKNQPTKMAAMDGMWNTEASPAAFSLVGWPDNKTMSNLAEIRIPYLIGIIGTRSITYPIIGIKDLKKQSIQKFQQGVVAYSYLQRARNGDTSAEIGQYLNSHLTDLGYGLLLSEYVDPSWLRKQILNRHHKDIYPNHVWLMYWSFRIMVAIGFFLLFIFFSWFVLGLKRKFDTRSKFRKILMFISVLSIPLPILAAEFGWIVQEYGRQPWSVFNILPTAKAASVLAFSQILTSLIIFIVLYTSLLIVDIYLMFVYAKRGPKDYMDKLPEYLKK